MAAEELAGSPKVTMSYAAGITAERRWKTTWSEAYGFAQSLVDEELPGFAGTGLRPQQIVVEPLSDELAPLAGDPASYSFALVTASYAIDYRDVAWPECIPRPDCSEGTTLKLKVRFSGQFLTLPAKAFAIPKPSSNPDGTPYTGAAPKPDVNGNNRILIPIREFAIELDRVTDYGHLDYAPYLGKVNEDEFLGSPPETLLVEGVDFDHSYVLNATNPHAYRITVTLRERRIRVGDDTYGWNHDYKANPPGWERVLIKTGPGEGDKEDRYPLTIFASLFVTSL